jgi:3-methyladenine DNA glycosylase AlkD
VKKAVSWALRNIGKRNPNLNKVAIKAAKEIQKFEAKPAKWIAADTVRDLKSATAQRRLKQKRNPNKTMRRI